MAHEDWLQLPRHKKAATATLLLVLVLVVLLDALIISAIVTGSIDGRAFFGVTLLAILGSPIDPIWINTIGAILAVACAFLAGDHVSDRIYYTFFAAIIIAVLSTITVFVILNTEATASKLYNHATVESLADSQGFKSAVRWFFGGIIVWLLGAAATLVGVRTDAT